jgi:hypothetical protein
MRLEHITGMEAGYTMGLRPDGRELLVVCIKGTFTLPRDGGEVQLAEKQLPLVESDIFTGEPGFSAPLYESDYAPVKPKCDVLLNGNAYASGGKPAERVEVGLALGGMKKFFAVVGDRFWLKGPAGFGPGRTLPFVSKPIDYGTAFGGTDPNGPDPAMAQACMANPVGRGFHHYLDEQFVAGTPLPNTEELDNPVSSPHGAYRSMSFGPVGRGWQPRATFAGTYDQHWLDNIFPFLPSDFDDRYYQAAPEDQQIPYPQGGERVTLLNLTPEGRTDFLLPNKAMLVWYLLKNGEEESRQAMLDTIILEPDAGRCMLIWRAHLPLKKNMFEVEMVVIGHDPEDRHKVVPEEDIAFPLPLESSDEAAEPVEEE